MKKIKRILIGCFLIVIILVVLGAVFSGIIIKKLITGAIREKTGVQVNVDNLQQGKLSYVDPKTGASLNIGSNKIPDTFPKDFPIYPNSTVTSSWVSNNFELTLTTKDNIDKVISYYQENLKSNGWTTQASGTNGNWIVSKTNLNGFLTINNSNNLTSILIVLGQTKN